MILSHVTLLGLTAFDIPCCVPSLERSARQEKDSRRQGSRRSDVEIAAPRKSQVWRAARVCEQASRSQLVPCKLSESSLGAGCCSRPPSELCRARLPRTRGRRRLRARAGTCLPSRAFLSLLLLCCSAPLPPLRLPARPGGQVGRGNQKGRAGSRAAVRPRGGLRAPSHPSLPLAALTQFGVRLALCSSLSALSLPDKIHAWPRPPCRLPDSRTLDSPRDSHPPPASGAS